MTTQVRSRLTMRDKAVADSQAAVRGAREPHVADAILFLAPTLQFLQLDVIGHLYLTDLLLAVALPFLVLNRGHQLRAPLPRTAIRLFLLWLMAQVVTDLIRASTVVDFGRGWAMIAFSLTSFCSIYLLIEGRPSRIALFAAGAALGALLSSLVTPSAYALQDPWKFGYGIGTTTIIALLAAWPRKGPTRPRVGSAALLLGASGLNLILGFRSLGAVTFIAALFVAVVALRRPGRDEARPLTVTTLVVAVLLAALGAWAALQVYSHAAESGWLGAEAKAKYEMQAVGSYGLLLGGRSESLVSTRAIADSPLIGHGSWAKDCYYSSLYLELRRDAGYFPGEENQQCLIPAHSYLLGSWVQAGVLGSVIWVWVLILAMRSMAVVYARRSRAAPFVAFVALLVIWNTLFSPYAGDARFMVPFYLVVVMSVIEWKPAGRASDVTT